MTRAATADQDQHSSETEHLDVLIIGAGVSGIGAAHRLRTQFPDRSFVILEAQDARGGTWWTHRYPGARSDSDLFTYGYRHKPWRGPSIAAGERDPRPTSTRSSRRTTWPAHPLPPPGHRADLVVDGAPVDGRGHPQRHRRAAADHRRLPVDVPGLLQPRRALPPRVAGHGAVRGHHRAHAGLARRPRHQRQAGARHRLRGDRGDRGAGDRARRRARDDAAALAVVLVPVADGPRARHDAEPLDLPRRLDPRDPAPPVHLAVRHARRGLAGGTRPRLTSC